MPDKTRRSRRIFISHAGRDTWIAKRIAQELKALGAYPFLDEAEVAIGQEFEPRILEFLDEADEFLVLLTPWSLSRPYVWAEMGIAWGRRIPIIGVLYGLSTEELQDHDGVPVFLKSHNLIELNDFDKYLGELAKRSSHRR
jgi:TIR domain-containing protein